MNNSINGVGFYKNNGCARGSGHMMGDEYNYYFGRLKGFGKGNSQADYSGKCIGNGFYYDSINGHGSENGELYG